jgi:hypothetical protein
MENAFGPEIETLAMISRTEYVNAAGLWTLNTDDVCTDLTALIATNPVDTDFTDIPVGSGSTDFTFISPLAGGDAGFAFSPSNTEGSVEVSVNLGTLPWLKYDWNSDGTLEDHPAVNATFGRYRGHDRIIYWKEVVQ